MRINPTTQFPLPLISSKPTHAPKTSFDQLLQTQQKMAVQDLKGDLRQVSADLKSGKISQEQASQKFVDLVIAKKNELNLSDSGLKKVQNAIGEIVSGDPAFASKLQSELKKI